ncbi:MAG: hypothetical protein IT374_24665 [Polyangiaceae bacterium]|nr:hypothetical protein [Polyangiaceae bacterium]
MVSFRAALSVFALAALPFVVACTVDGGAPKNSLKSAGGLDEARMPVGLKGDSPAPTGAIPRDKRLEAAWYKRAKHGEKPPTAGDRSSL